jgi:hypothetical protein
MTTTVTALALSFAVVAGSSAQQPVTRTASITGTATIQAIDSTNRTITLRDAMGQEDIYAVGPEVKRFNEFKVGDTVKMTYYESVVFQVRKPGDKPEAAGATAEAAVTRSKGAPGGTLSVQEKMTVTVKAIDPAIPSVTVTTPAGATVTRKVEDKKNIEGLKVGDKIDITYTRAMVINIEPAK